VPRFDQPIEPMTLGNMGELGVRAFPCVGLEGIAPSLAGTLNCQRAANHRSARCGR
jgi:hypothetical protein